MYFKIVFSLQNQIGMFEKVKYGSTERACLPCPLPHVASPIFGMLETILNTQYAKSIRSVVSTMKFLEPVLNHVY